MSVYVYVVGLVRGEIGGQSRTRECAGINSNYHGHWLFSHFVLLLHKSAENFDDAFYSVVSRESRRVKIVVGSSFDLEKFDLW